MPSTLGTPAVAQMILHNREAIALTFKAKKVFVVGEPVQLQSDGEVDSVTVGEKTLGVVYTNNKVIGEDVVIITSLLAVLDNAKASGIIPTGALLKIDATATQTNAQPTYTVAAATEVATAIALVGAASGAQMRVGVLTSPIISV